MSAYSFDELEFTRARKKKEEEETENNTQNPKIYNA